MNNSVFVADIKADETMSIVRDLRKLGLVQGTDFNFAYRQQRYVDGDWTQVEHGGAEFYFSEGKWCTYVSLKYGK